MIIHAVLGNPNHPEYGVATIPFPIPHDQYAHCMELLEALEIGDALKADCQVEEIDSFYSVLKRTEKLTVNVEELNYLAKRLDSFDAGEAAQFQAMAHKLELSELKELINLTFCCQEATVITDFSDLAAVGRDHYMNLHGGCATVTELEVLDGEGTARQLIASGSGTVTPYGVVYDNGMKLEQAYDGQIFPCYYYEPRATMVAVTPKSEPENTEHITWLYLPMAQEEIDRVLQRSGIADSADARLRLEHSQLPDEVNALLDMRENVLKNRIAMAHFCYEHGGRINGDWMQNFGYIVETEHYSYCLRCNPSPGDYNAYLTCFDLDVQRQNMAHEKPLVGRVTFVGDDAQEFTDAEAFLKCIREELPYFPTTGFHCEVLTDDPAVRKQVDDIFYDFFGEENPHQIEDYQNEPKQDMAFGGV